MRRIGIDAERAMFAATGGVNTHKGANFTFALILGAAGSLLSEGLVDADGYQAILDGTLGVHPTFFYESLWNFVGIFLIYWIGKHWKKFDGQVFWSYVLWYGLGRFWIEGLRTDSLYLFNWTFLGQPIRVSQALSLLLAVTAAVMLFYNIKIKKHSRDELLVNQVAAEAAEGTAEADISTAEAGESVPAGQEEPEFPQPPETQNGEGGRD